MIEKNKFRQRVVPAISGAAKPVAVPKSPLGPIDANKRSYCIFVEDAAARMALDYIGLMLNMDDVRGNNLYRLALRQAADAVTARRKEIRRGWPKEKAESYEELLTEAIDMTDTAALAASYRSDLAQKVRFQDLDRSLFMAMAGGCFDAAARVHYLVTGKRGRWRDARDRLREADMIMPAEMLNENTHVDIEYSRKLFGIMFKKLTDNILEVFTKKEDTSIRRCPGEKGGGND